jgi:transposase
VKSVEQQSLQAVHRIRTQWQTTRVARINGVRGLLAEHGYVLPRGARTILRRVIALLDDAETRLPELLRLTLMAVIEEVQTLDAKIATADRQLTHVAATHPVAARLQTIPGVGVLTATALVASVGHIEAFRRGRQFASWLGLTPRESSSGGRRTLGQISKRGDVHLRCLLIHGARAVLRCALLAAARRPDRVTRLQQWALAIAVRRGRRKATVALANKLARVVWAVWRREDTFHAAPALAA